MNRYRIKQIVKRNLKQYTRTMSSKSLTQLDINNIKNFINAMSNEVSLLTQNNGPREIQMLRTMLNDIPDIALQRNLDLYEKAANDFDFYSKVLLDQFEKYLEKQGL